MNLPNKLTILRMILVPFFILFMLIPTQTLPASVYIACAIYILASFTDFLDGYIARKYNLVSDFGKVMDPLADKVLVASGFILLTGMGKIPAIITVVVILRDYIITAIREVASKKGIAIAAVLSGKVKTVFQLIGISFCIIDPYPFGAIVQFLIRNFNKLNNTIKLIEFFTSPIVLINIISTISISLAFITTIWSLFDYIMRFSKYLKKSK